MAGSGVWERGLAAPCRQLFPPCVMAAGGGAAAGGGSHAMAGLTCRARVS